jgi:2-keto-4-pentenoate hydratase/2-oxohepta-3-ene-1,7-dioic acid hydratase in catechol pathway
MRLVSFEVKTPFGPRRRIGAVQGAELNDAAQFVDLNTGYGLLLREGGDARWKEIADAALPSDMMSFLEGGKEAMARARQVLDFASNVKADLDYQLTFARNQVKLLAPTPRPSTMRDFSEYLEHMSRRSGSTVHAPLWYIYAICYKGNPNTVYGPDDDMLWPDFTERLDPELELAAIVNKAGRNIKVEDAMDYVAGWTIFVDPSARDVQFRETLGPYKGKDFCTFLGPCIVTPDEFDEMNARCGIRVNGEDWFEGNTGAPRQFATPELVAYASDAETIQPGDVIVGGTISYGCSMDLDRWIKPGDVCEYWIEGIGTIKTTVVREPNPHSYVRDGLPGRLELPADAAELLEKIRSKSIDMNTLGQYARLAPR